MTSVRAAVERRISVRGFRPEPVAGAVMREILACAARAPSGGNLQPWRVYALAGAPLAALKAQMAEAPPQEPAEYEIFPPNLWEPFHSRHEAAREERYALLGIPAEDRADRARQALRNGQFYGAPVGLFFCLDRRLGPPQWADLGMFMQTVMLLAVDHGLDTCPQEFWANYPATVRRALGLPDELMVFAGMSLGRRDDTHPLNALRTTRAPLEDWAELRGFD